MNLPVPVLAVLGIALLVAALLVLRRRSAGRDLIAPPRFEPAQPPPRAEPSRAWPAGAAPIGDLAAEIDNEVRELMAADRKIDAIKLVRASMGLSLAEAKELVERM